jgi:small-conductance mechanosensitive channel
MTPGRGRLIRGLLPGLALAVLLAASVRAEVVTSPAAPADTTVHADDSGTIQRPKASTAIAGQAEAGISLGKAAGLPTIGKTKPTSGTLDYAAWEKMAGRAEAELAAANTAGADTLDRLRSQLTDWREAFLGAENANAARIDTLRRQISALGPAPDASVTEPEDIAKRRVELADQLVRLQAPGIAAEEAYRRADGLIAEIDRVLRERQADALLKLWPSPVNPANWPAGMEGVGKPLATFWAEVARRVVDPTSVRDLVNNLPLVLFYLVLAVGLMWRGERGMTRLLRLLRGPATPRAQRIWDFLASLALALVPVAGLTALSEALKESGLLGPLGTTALGNLGWLGFVAVTAHWLGGRAFPPGGGGLPLNLTVEERREARLLTTGFGIVMALARFRRMITDQIDIGDAGNAGNAVALFPLLVVAGILLWRMARLLRAHRPEEATPGEEGRVNYRDRTLFLGSRLIAVIGVVGPILAAVGYVAAARALLFPTALSLALVVLVVLVQRLIADVSALVMRSDGPEQEGLVPVLIGFALALGTLPVFALIWGARVSDLTELWARFQEGFQLGQTRISPTDFLIFVVIFGIGLTLTRLLQGALKTSVLPRTAMDQGGQNAIVAGLGYGGIFLSALVAIDSTGIDLSGLAIVAGALSVGIGFGLQTIVSNFVSGVILLIERPVSEGDWIEVGPVAGIVKAISVRSTRIQTFDRSDVIVPNSDLITGRVTNWTRFNLTGRLMVTVAVPFTSDSRKVERILREIAEAQPLVLLSPPPIVALMSFGLETMIFEVRVILRDVNFQIEVRSEMNHMIARRFAEEGIAFSNAHRDYQQKVAEAPAVDADAAATLRAQDALLAELMGPAVAARVKAAREAVPTAPDIPALAPPSPEEAPK